MCCGHPLVQLDPVKAAMLERVRATGAQLAPEYQGDCQVAPFCRLRATSHIVVNMFKSLLSRTLPVNMPTCVQPLLGTHGSRGRA